MARERMVTRTVTRSDYTVMAVNVTTAQVEILTLSLGGLLEDTDTALKKLKKIYETEENKLVSITQVNVTEVLYGMSELDFIQHAQILPPRTTQEQE